MNRVTLFLIKELRKRTGINIMDCKKALTEANGNIEIAIKNMLRSGVIKAEKKASNIANNGTIITKIEKNYGAIVEINCQTDFVAKNKDFQKFANKVITAAVNNKISDIETLKTQFEEERISLVSKFDENINIRRFAFFKSNQDSMIGFYQHGIRIGVLVVMKGFNEELAKKIAMHIAASKPEFLNPKYITSSRIEKEYQTQMNNAIQSGKSREIAEKIAKGRITKFVNEISLSKQIFIMEPKKTIDQLLKEHHSEVINFIRFEIGEHLEKI